MSHRPPSILFVAALCLGLSIEVSAQTTPEHVETVSLYDELGPEERVPVITCIDLEATGRLLAIGGDDHRGRLWDVGAKKIRGTLQEHLDWVRGLAFSPDRSKLVTVDQAGQIKLWNTADGSLLQTHKEPVRGTRKIVFEPNGTHFAVCGFDSNVRIYDSATGRLATTLPTHGTNNRAIAYSPDGNFLAVAGRTGVVRVWNTSNFEQTVDIKTDGRPINALAYSPDSAQLAFAGDGPFIVFAKLDGTITKTLPERPGKTFALAFCGPDMLASGESDNAIRLWNLADGKEASTLLGHTGTISTMIFEPNTKRLITGSFDTTVRFWDISQDITPSPSAIHAAVPNVYEQKEATKSDPFLATPATPTAF